MATSEPVVVSWRNEGLLFEGVTAHGRVDLASGHIKIPVKHQAAKPAPKE